MPASKLCQDLKNNLSNNSNVDDGKKRGFVNSNNKTCEKCSTMVSLRNNKGMNKIWSNQANERKELSRGIKGRAMNITLTIANMSSKIRLSSFSAHVSAVNYARLSNSNYVNDAKNRSFLNNSNNNSSNINKINGIVVIVVIRSGK